VKKKQIPFESMLSIYNVATAILLMVVHTLVSAHPNIPKAYLQNREVDWETDCVEVNAKYCYSKTNTCPSETMTSLATKEECGEALKSLGFTVESIGDYTLETYPKGCFAHGSTALGPRFNVNGNEHSNEAGHTQVVCKLYEAPVGYKGATELKWCADNEDVAIRNGCTSDKDCLNNGRTICDRDPDCHGIAWYRNRLNVGMKICRSTRMATKTDGWRTMMKIE